MDEIELLQQRIQQLEQERVEFQNQLSHIAWKLRQPLVPIQGFVGVLLEDENEEQFTQEERREFYTIMDESVDSLRDTVRTLQKLLGY